MLQLRYAFGNLLLANEIQLISPLQSTNKSVENSRLRLSVCNSKMRKQRHT